MPNKIWQPAVEGIDKDLFEVIPDDCDMTDYCGECGRYLTWEERVATPLLEAAGHEVLFIASGEWDSFGPLSRVIGTRKDGVLYHLYYG